MTTNIEVEYRGTISKDEFDVLSEKFSKEGKFKESKKRKIICYSPNDKDVKKDIRIRETNGTPEIVIKLGNWGNEAAREEISIKCEDGQFDSLTRVLALLGYDKGFLCNRNAVAYEYKGVEFSLVEVPDHSYYFEAEILTNEEEAENAKQVVKEICKDLGLNIWTDEEFFTYIDILNKEANLAFEYNEN